MTVPTTGINAPLVHKALHVLSMEHNLILPFIIREAGVTVADTPKIHATSPTVQHHSTLFEEYNLRIFPGITWCVLLFPTKFRSAYDTSDTLPILHLTHNVLTSNPHSEADARSEQNILDFQGNLIPNIKRIRILIPWLEEDTTMVTSSHISSIESEYIDECIFKTDSPPQCDTDFKTKEVGAMLDACTLADLLEDRGMCGKFTMTTGSTDVHTSNYLY